MKILLLNSICGHGSTGRIVKDLWESLTKEGYQVKVAFGLGEGNGVNIEDCICYNNKFGYHIHNIAAKITDKAGLYSTLQTKKLIKEIVKFDPDIIHIHQLHGYHINYQVLFNYLAESEKKVIWTLHDCWAITGHCAHFTYNKCEQWKTGCITCNHLKEYPKCYFKGNVKQNYELKKKLFTSVKNMTIVTPSEWLANIVKQSFLEVYPVKVINNGIDTTVFKPVNSNFKEYNDIEGKTMVLAVANVWNEKKGLDDVIKLAEELNENYKVVMVGLTEAQKESIPNSILGITRTKDVHELREIYSTADVFVNFTYEDTFPTVNIESLACCTPVITYKTGGSPDVIVNESCGFVISQGDVKEARKIITSKKFPEPKFEIENYSKNIFSKNYIKIYEER